VQMAKQAIDSGGAYPFMEPLAAAATAYTDDAVEGFAAFQEKRPASFSGS
jgi:1,4-dihydroxy-2-naphthoyl-CoA synthase